MLRIYINISINLAKQKNHNHMYKKVQLLISFLLLITITVYSQNTYLILNDSLNGKTNGTLVGGIFTSEGYHPVNNNHILYQITGPIPNGYIEFEVKGVDISILPSGADAAFIGMYDGRGITEPASYYSDYKDNFFRWNFHWRQDKNVFKCVINCAAPTPERLNATKAYFRDNIRDFVSEPNGSGMTWDKNKWYKMKLEWKDKKFKAYVDGTVKWSSSGPYDYAPIIHRIWIGSAPGYGTKYTQTFSELVFRNVKMYSFDQNPVSVSLINSNKKTINIITPNNNYFISVKDYNYKYYKVLDYSGKVYLENKLTENEINLSQLKNNFYILILKNEDISETIKIIITK